MGQRGGKRPGAGRPKGAKTKRAGAPDPTLAAAEPAAQPGEILPKRILLDVARWHYAAAAALQQEWRRVAPEQRALLADRIAVALDRAARAARWAAPYVHPRLSAIEVHDPAAAGGAGGGGGGEPERRRVTFAIMGRVIEQAAREGDDSDLDDGDNGREHMNGGGNTIEHDTGEFAGNGGTGPTEPGN